MYQIIYEDFFVFTEDFKKVQRKNDKLNKEFESLLNFTRDKFIKEVNPIPLSYHLNEITSKLILKKQ